MNGLTPEQILEACREGEYRVLAQHETVIVVDRPLPGGGAGDVRSLVFFHLFAGTWSASCHVRRCTEANPLTYDTRCVGRRPLQDDLELRIWIGGVSSIPADGRETQVLLRA